VCVCVGIRVVRVQINKKRGKDAGTQTSYTHNTHTNVHALTLDDHIYIEVHQLLYDKGLKNDLVGQTAKHKILTSVTHSVSIVLYVNDAHKQNYAHRLCYS